MSPSTSEATRSVTIDDKLIMIGWWLMACFWGTDSSPGLFTRKSKFFISFIEQWLSRMSSSPTFFSTRDSLWHSNISKERCLYILTYLMLVKGNHWEKNKLAARHVQLNLHQCRRESSVLPMRMDKHEDARSCGTSNHPMNCFTSEEIQRWINVDEQLRMWQRINRRRLLPNSLQFIEWVGTRHGEALQTFRRLARCTVRPFFKKRHICDVHNTGFLNHKATHWGLEGRFKRFFRLRAWMRETAEKQAFKLNPTGSLVRSKSDPKLPNRENDRRGVQHWQSLTESSESTNLAVTQCNLCCSLTFVVPLGWGLLLAWLYHSRRSLSRFAKSPLGRQIKRVNLKCC